MTATKFKVGDKVQIKNDLVSGKYYGNWRFTGEMSRIKEELFIVAQVNEGYYELGEYFYGWTDEMLDSVPSPNELKVGDMVWVSDISIGEAKNADRKRELLAILPEDIENRYITRSSVKGCLLSFPCAFPIVEEEAIERKLILTKTQWEKLQEIFS